MRRVLAGLSLSLLACTGILPDESKSTATDDAPDGDEVPEIGAPDEVVLDDDDDGLLVDISGSEATGWLLGVAWPDQDYEDEACKSSGDICHPLDSDGGVVEWCDQHEGEEGCTGIPQLYYRQGQVSLMLKPEVGVGCWSWGDEADYWKDCEEESWDAGSY